jgi:hypothetical protein
MKITFLQTSLYFYNSGTDLIVKMMSLGTSFPAFSIGTDLIVI